MSTELTNQNTNCTILFKKIRISDVNLVKNQKKNRIFNSH